MCGLCGIFGEEAHWATRLESSGQSSVSAQRRQLRARRIAIINRLLESHHIKVSDWQGVQYQLYGATGKTALAENLNQIWPAVESISGRPFDPLS
ncbi:hypothetical protein [Neisseria wadsworthii]|nr:hypothetical protein [Neisseria wadsworthii]QMT36373.1 hypothetical protein H3L96_03885 [Neisseria wadsworthii]